MDTVDLGDDDLGYIAIKMAGAEVRLDLWETNNRLFELHRQFDGQPASEWLAALVDYLESKGYPRVSFYLASKFADAIYARVASLKNDESGDGKPVSPDSTVSTPSA